jgi:hypothetical protein
MKRAVVAALAAILVCAAVAYAATESRNFTIPIDQTVTLQDGSTARLHGDLALDVSVMAPDPIPVADCSDGIDNDGDDLSDFPNDPGCAGNADTLEVDEPPPPPPPPPGDNTPPSAPSNMRLATATQSKIVVAWNASTDDVGVVDYRVYRDGAVRGTTDNTLDWADFNLPCGTSYEYAVEALDAAGNTSTRSTLTVSTAACDNPPPPPSTGFPDETNTGVPAGVTLTSYNGPSTITQDGTVIDGKSLGCITVRADDVVIRNSRVSCGGQYYSVDVNSEGSVLVEDSEIDCRSRNANGAGRMNITLRRVEITNCENGLSVARDVTVEDSLIHELYHGGGAHADGMQFEGGAGNVNIIHNTIFANTGTQVGTSAFIADLSGHHDWLVERNLFSGGSYTVYCVLGKGDNWVIRDNAFSLEQGRNGTSGLFGFARECSDETQSGNYVYETGQPLKLG